MKHSQEVLKTATMLERLALSSILAGISTLYTKEVAPTMPTRAASDSEYSKELELKDQDLLFAVSQVAPSVRRVHEASRAQRDVEILTAGHKRLMLSCVDASVSRYDKLTREIKAIEGTPQ